MAIATVKKPVAPTFIASAVPATTVPFDNISDLRSALRRVATFGLVGTKNRPLLADGITDGERDRLAAAFERHLDEGKSSEEFTDSAQTSSRGIDPIWLPTVVVDVQRILASMIDIDHGNEGSQILKTWNLQVNGYCVPCRKVLGAVAGEKGSKLTLKGIVTACR